MKGIVHIPPVREIYDERVHDYVIRGRDVENRETALYRLTQEGYTVMPVPDDGQEHQEWTMGRGAKRCPACNKPPEDKK